MSLSKDPDKRRRQLANLKKGNRWKAGESGNPKGRPTDRVTPLFVEALGKEATEQYSGLSATEIDIIEKRLMDMPASLYDKFLNEGEGDTPAFMTGYIKAIKKDMKDGKTTTLDLLRERQYGKAAQSIDITTNGKDMSLEPMTLRLVASKEELERLKGEVAADEDKK